MRVLRAVAAWLLILRLAMLNGVVREVLLVPALGGPIALVTSGLLLSCCILIVAVALARWLGLLTTKRCLSVGTIWLTLTLLFEFGFERLVQRRSWADLLAAYRFEDGNIWPVVLVVTFVSPLLAAYVRGLAERRKTSTP